MVPLLQTAAVSCLLLLAYTLYRRRRLQLPLPPGPPGRPLVGNLGDLPNGLEVGILNEWAKTYDSDILYLNFAGQNVIIVNSMEGAEELFDRRSSKYSSRPQFTMMNELMGWDFSLGGLKYGSTWRRYRKFMHQSFNSSSVIKFEPHITKSVHTFVRNLLSTPDDFSSHVQSLAAEAILLVTYGIQIQPRNDPYVELPEKAIRSAAEALIPGRFLVDALPWLKYVPEWMPFAGFQRYARECKQRTIDMVEIPYHALEHHNVIQSLVSVGLQANEEKEDVDELVEREDMIKRVAGNMYAAASDTTVSTITSGILALTCYPEVLKKAQAEVDAVLQPGQLPNLSHRNDLPYLSALIKELLRWGTVVPLGIAHFIEVEDIYKGYRIPANTIVMPNAWGLLHDENVYPDPLTFNPDRFLKDGKLDTSIRDPEDIAFGFGRRICPGRHFASLLVWMAMAHIITLFDISKPVDETGKVIEPKEEWTPGSLSRPVPFKCKIVARSREAIAAIQSTNGYEYFK
ncbi:hypothetical protein AX16_002119 [Volvariella volvacea WC 439]|nr:hypothetical protein AX16_002119 [Volvariella volvacea WC 439]